MSPESQNEVMRQFFAAYFHQDWDLDGDDWEGIVELVVNDRWSTTEVEQLAASIERLSHQDHPVEAWESILFEDLGCYYDPSVDGLAIPDWLSRLSVKLRQISPR
jgi:hypothetical protein